MNDDWVTIYDSAMNNLMDAKEEIIRLNSELMKWKSTAEDLQTEINFLRRDRDYWQDMATRGGGNG